MCERAAGKNTLAHLYVRFRTPFSLARSRPGAKCATPAAMSIKRSKQRNFGSRDSDEADTGFGSKKVEPPKVWADETTGKPDSDFTPYATTAKFAKGALLVHSKFGKGIVIDVEGARVEVLFEEGAKKLGHAG